MLIIYRKQKKMRIAQKVIRVKIKDREFYERDMIKLKARKYFIKRYLEKKKVTIFRGNRDRYKINKKNK